MMLGMKVVALERFIQVSSSEINSDSYGDYVKWVGAMAICIILDTALVLYLSYSNSIGQLEHWEENYSDIDAEFPFDLKCSSPNLKDIDETLDHHDLNQDEQAIVWWIVVFTCVLQTLHSLPARAIEWLLKFLSTLLVFLGRYTDEIRRIAIAFPLIRVLTSKRKFLCHLCANMWCVHLAIVYLNLITA